MLQTPFKYLILKRVLHAGIYEWDISHAFDTCQMVASKFHPAGSLYLVVACSRGVAILN